MDLGFTVKTGATWKEFFMNALRVFILVTMACFVGSFVHADIYEWTDESGVVHFSNYAPPDNAKIIVKTEEVPYDEAADMARMEAERVELARQEIAEREAALDRREAEAERRLAEAGRQAEDTLQKAEDLLEAADTGRDAYRSGGYYGYYPAYYSYPYSYNKWYYHSNRGSIYFGKPYYKKYYKYSSKHRPYIKHYGDYQNKFQSKPSHYTNRYAPKTHLPKSHFKSQSRQNFGRSQISGARSGLRKY